MYRDFTLHVGIILVGVSLLILVGLVPTNAILMFAVSFAAGIFSITDLIQEVNNGQKGKLISILDFIAIASVIIFLAIRKEEYDSLFQQPSNFVTFLGFSIVILTIGIRNSKYILNKQNEIEAKNKTKDMSKATMDDKQVKAIASQLAVAEYNSVLEYNNIIVELKKCDDFVYRSGRVHDGWGHFHDILRGGFNIYNKPFYDTFLNDLFEEFLQEIGEASTMFALGATPESFKEIQIINMLGVDMEVCSFSIPSNHQIQLQKGLKLLKSSLGKWEELKKKSSERFEASRENINS